MATAKKLPSGSWRVQIVDHYEQVADASGGIKRKAVRKSFTAQTKKEAERMAAEWELLHKEYGPVRQITLGEAIDSYIASREQIVSPRTVSSYRAIRRTYCKSLMAMPIGDIKQADVQTAINEEAADHAPKTVRNIHGLISATLGQFRPDLRLQTSLPKKVRPDIYVPSDDEIRRLLQYVADTPMELPILLAAFGPMRRGEICALTDEDISGTVVHVHRNMVRTDAGEWITKAPKSYAGDRYIDYPDFVADKWQGLHGRLVLMDPNAITKKFGRTLKAAGLPHFRFHDLRHYSASIQHALGVPDAYIMQRGGWETDGVLKGVYRHTLEQQNQKMSDRINEHFSEIVLTNVLTK